MKHTKAGKWVPSPYGKHTGYYKFKQTHDSLSFHINGIPCGVQEGMDNLVFYTATDLTGISLDVTPVERHSKISDKEVKSK